jgi:uncharacterized membrane protein
MKRKWRVDNATIVDFQTGSFGRQSVSVNGEEFYRRRPWRGKALYEFVVPGSGAKAALEVRPAVVSGQAHTELRVGGRVMVEQSEIIPCKGCGKLPNGYDAFCGNCGQALPKPESYTQRRQLKNATKAIRYLAILFLIVGIALFFLTKSNSEQALTRVASLPDSANYPALLAGKQYTVGQVRRELAWAPWSALLVNAILAVVMTILYFWGKRAPLAAIMVATATYFVVIIGNAIADPRTLAQGLIVKIIVIVMLVNGIKAALALRNDDG